jgi:MFS transporter, DHA1 family, multidrug resistance protein
VAQLFAVAGMALILPILPLLVRELGVSDLAAVQRWSGAIFAAPFLFAALMTPVWGWVGDRSGRKIMVVRALAGLSVAVFCMGFARTPEQLLVLRVLQGIVSGFIPAVIALVSASAPRSQLGYALGTLSSAQAGGIVVGPLVGGVLADLVGFRNLFFVTAAIELAVAIAVLVLVTERNRAAMSHSSPLENARWAFRWPVRVAILGLFGTQLSILLVQPFFALFVESLGVRREHLSSATGAIVGATGLAMLVMAPRWGKLGDRIGRRRALLIAMTGGCIAFALQALARDARVLFVLRLLQGTFAAGMLPALYATIASHTPEERRGGVVGFGSSATLFGGLVGPILGGYLASVLGMRPVFLVSTVLFAANALNTLQLPSDREPAHPEPRRSWELPTQ